MEPDKKKTILIVDDDEVILGAIKALLEVNGYKVLTAVNYKETLKIVNHEALDLMLLDIMLPEVKGTDILPITKKTAYFGKPFPVIYISARPKESVNLEGSDGFVQKPFKNKELLQYIDNILKKFSKEQK